MEPFLNFVFLYFNCAVSEAEKGFSRFKNKFKNRSLLDRIYNLIAYVITFLGYRLGHYSFARDGC